MKKFTDLKDNYLGLRISDGAGLYLSSLVFLYIAQIIVIAMASLLKINQSNLYLQYGIMLVNQGVFFMCPMIYGKIFSRDMIEPSRIKRTVNYKQGLILPLIALAAILIGLPLANIFTTILEKIGYNYTPGIPVATIERWWTLPLSLIFVALLPAIGEEFLFRGSIGRALKARSYCFAMIMSSLMFSIFHGNAIQLLHQFIVGLVASYCYFVTGSLMSSMIIHFTNNAFAIFGGFIMDAVKMPALGLGATIGIYVAMIVAGVFLLLVLLRWLTKECKKRAGMEVQPASAKAFFTDLGKAFYPKGMKDNYRRLNVLMKTLYNDPIDNISTETQVVKNDDLSTETPYCEKDNAVATAPVANTYDDVKDEKIRRALIEADKEMIAKRKRVDRTALGMSIAIAALILLINLISGFTK